MTVEFDHNAAPQRETRPRSERDLQEMTVTLGAISLESEAYTRRAIDSSRIRSLPVVNWLDSSASGGK